MKRLLIVMLCMLVTFSIGACGTKGEPDVDVKNTAEKETETADSTEENADSSENIQENAASSDNIGDVEEIEDIETRKNPEELEYIACTMDELVTEMYGDIEAVAAKYNGKYLEITGILDSVEVDDSAGSIVVYMKSTVEPPVNIAATVTGAYYLWENEWMTMEECKEMVRSLVEGDEVVLRGYMMEDFSITDTNDTGWRWCWLQLIEIHKNR